MNLRWPASRTGKRCREIVTGHCELAARLLRRCVAVTDLASVINFMNMPRFREPDASDEMAMCVACDQTLHYEKLNEDGFCPECCAEWCEEDVKAVNE